MASYFSTLLWGTSQLDDAIDKATSELLPSGAEDIALNLEICDQIRSKSAQPKDAMKALKRRLNHKNPNVQLLTLGLTDVCIKNGGDQFLVEIASREFMDNLVSILKMPGLNYDVKGKILRLVQGWALAFEGKTSLGYVGEVYRTLQREGFNFPPRDPVVANSAMVDTQTAPEWIDSDVCLRSHRPSQSLSGSRHRSAREATDADLQRAIQLSLQEVGAAGGHRPGCVPSPSPWQISEPPLVVQPANGVSSRAQVDDEDDPDLRAAIEASLQEANAPKPSAPVAIDSSASEGPYESQPGYSQSYPSTSATPKPAYKALPNYDLEPLESDAILTFSQTVDQVQAQGGRDLARYPAVTELFDKANGLRPKLAMSLSDTGRKEQVLSEMHEKLSQAVRLYDKLLTEQVSHPSWRTTPSAASSSNQQVAPAGYPAQYQPAESSSQYARWPQAQQAQTPSPQTPLPSTAQPYIPPQRVVQDQSPAASIPYPLATPKQTQPQVAYQGQIQSPNFAQPPPPPQQFTSPTTIPQYSNHIVTNAHPTSVPPPPSHFTPTTQSPPAMQPQAPRSPQQSRSPPQSHGLSRHATFSAPPPPTTKYLSRSHTIQTHAPQQLQQLQQTSVPAQIPNFPSVPASPPQTFQAYGSVAPPSEPGRKEAMLIEL